MKQVKNTKKISLTSTILYIVFVLLLFGVVAFLWTFTDGGQAELKTFYIEHQGKRITSSTSEVVLYPNKKAQFDVKYLTVNLDETTEDFKVEIKPIVNADTNFSFTANGTITSFNALKDTDFSDYFSLEKGDGYFVITPPENFTVEDAICFAYSTQEVEFVTKIDNSKTYFKLVVSSQDGKSVYEINLNPYVKVQGISVDNITFGGIKE